MTAYWVNDGGDDSDGSTLAKAFVSFAAMIADVPAALTTGGNIIYVVYDHNEPNAGGNKTYTGPTSGTPVIIISVDNNSTPAYRVGTGNQMYSADGAYNLVLDGSFALYGIRIVSGSYVNYTPDADELFYTENVTIVPAASSYWAPAAGGSSKMVLYNTVVDLTADGTTGRSTSVINVSGGSAINIIGLTFTNPGYRTGSIIGNSVSVTMCISNADFSGFTNGTECELISGVTSVIMNNCKTKASYVPFLAAPTYPQSRQELYNVSDADDPTLVYINDFFGKMLSSTAVTRSGGSTVEATACSWWIHTLAATCCGNSPFYTPWIYGTLSSTGSKTFTVYITNDTADFTNAEVWLEVECMGTSNSPLTTLAQSKMATVLTAAQANLAPCADDTSSTWSGGSASFTYKQSIAVTATVGEEGIYRARIAVAVASLANTRYFFIDPKVTVS